MATLSEFVQDLLVSVVEMVRIFVFDIALADPLSFVNWAVGVVLVTGAVLVLGYLALGAVGRELGVLSPAPGQPRDRRVE